MIKVPKCSILYIQLRRAQGQPQQLKTKTMKYQNNKTQIVAIPDEDCTELVRNYNGSLFSGKGEGVGIVWAGCFYGPKNNIEEVVSGDLLAKCKALLEDPNTPWLPANFTDPAVADGFGPINTHN